MHTYYFHCALNAKDLGDGRKKAASKQLSALFHKAFLKLNKQRTGLLAFYIIVQFRDRILYDLKFNDNLALSKCPGSRSF